MKVSSLISTAPKRLPGGATVNNLAKVLATASQGVVIGLGSVSVFNALLKQLHLPAWHIKLEVQQAF